MGEVIPLNPNGYIGSCSECGSKYWQLVADTVGPDCKITGIRCAGCDRIIPIKVADDD